MEAQSTELRNQYNSLTKQLQAQEQEPAELTQQAINNLESEIEICRNSIEELKIIQTTLADTATNINPAELENTSSTVTNITSSLNSHLQK